VDFGDVFNVSVQNEPVQIKEECICIMDPSTTFFIKTVQSEYDLQAWFDWILERSRECRSTKLLRPVFREEYFEVGGLCFFLYSKLCFPEGRLGCPNHPAAKTGP
jgi:hypothetical protein